MSSKIAARKGTDTGYIEALKRKAKKFGLTAEQIGEFQHPRVIFETAENDGYSTEQFAKFNKSSKKAMSPIEAAVKVSKTIKSETVEHIAEKISDFDTLGELYSNTNAINEIFNTLQKDGVIASVDRPQYIVEGGGVTGAGKEFLETVLIGSVVTEKNIRGLNRDGCKSIRQKLVRAITPLIENKGMSGYSITKELNEAVDLSMQVAIHKNFNSVDELVSQGKLFGKDEDPVSVEIARKLEGTQKSFAEFMQTMNGGLKYAAQGEADIFLGGVESREDILGRMLNLKKAMGNVIDFFKGLDFFKGDFVKKAVPVFTDSGAVEYADRWMPESNELSLKKAGGAEDNYRLIAKGGFVEGEHPRTVDGKFTSNGRVGENGENDKPRRNDKPLTAGELKTFIDESLADKKAPYKRAVIGKINEDAQKRIETAYGEKVSLKNINIDNYSIHHAVTNLNHNLEPEDLLLAADVINSATDITKSDVKHQDSDVLVFKKDIDGEITFLTEVRVKNGYLLVFDAWRQKKARSRKRSDAAKGSPELTSETSFPHDGLSTVSLGTGEKSRGNVDDFGDI
jgi:hypothetical protein